ncbi:ARM repeat-containing protein [Saccharata proteae CBS 121410]|uniref:ARM repeat-containing protein n=1 Tax=Saccharata proteae CBS 121410 TaxID=1314787 RepID=A0A9P4HV16_9PEZI|nr:ARM repeat-containing protein [Saccharata proteae CBS 121410]
MDFLKSAVASAISKGPAFGYSFGDRVDIDQSIWTLHNGTKREDGSKCSIFSFDVTANKSRLPLARNALRKLRTIRHPGVIKVLDTVETETYIYIATERLTPLGWHTRRKSLAEETIKWGLHNVAKTLKFINGDAVSVHGSVRTSSVFTSESGEWKLGGFDVLSSMKEDDAVIYTYGSLVPDSGRYAPPEVVRDGWNAIKRSPVPAPDAYDFGILVYETFNGGFQSSDQLSQPKSIPSVMQQSYRRLTNPNPKARLSVHQFLEQGQRQGGFFQTPLINLTEGIESLGLKGEVERDEVLSQLDEVSNDFPEEFFKMKVLPELLKSVEFGGGGPKVFTIIMKIGAKLSDEEYDAQITPVVIRLFTSPDRAIRVCLLDNLPLMIDHLSQKIVNDKIFPQMLTPSQVTGFTDVAPVLREQTVKAVLTVITKLSDRTINGELLRHLAKTANDEQAGIRTNTTICLGKIARNLGQSSRTKVLTAAFARALRDPFVHARNAALLALAATVDLYTDDDCATKLLPGICPSLVDKEKLVRESANKTLEVYLARIRKYQQTLPETVLPPPAAIGTTAQAPRIGTPQNDTSWAGWAISSFTNKITAATGEIEPNPNASASFSDDFGAEAETEDFGAAWGDDFGDEEDPFAPPKPSTSSASTTAVDDQGEPDFAGWLSAQTAAKSQAKKPLPKGLTKASGLRPAVGPRANTAGSIAKKTAATVVPVKEKAKPVVPKKEVVAAKAVEEDLDDGWGDAWE